jgi:hypothetical protein
MLSIYLLLNFQNLLRAISKLSSQEHLWLISLVENRIKCWKDKMLSMFTWTSLFVTLAGLEGTGNESWLRMFLCSIRWHNSYIKYSFWFSSKCTCHVLRGISPPEHLSFWLFSGRWMPRSQKHIVPWFKLTSHDACWVKFTWNAECLFTLGLKTVNKVNQRPLNWLPHNILHRSIFYAICQYFRYWVDHLQQKLRSCVTWPNYTTCSVLNSSASSANVFFKELYRLIN